MKKNKQLILYYKYHLPIEETFWDKNVVLFKVKKTDLENYTFLSLPNNVWRLIVFAPFLIIIIIYYSSRFFLCDMNVSTARSQEQNMTNPLYPKIENLDPTRNRYL
jgi:hypothetical protein